MVSTQIFLLLEQHSLLVVKLRVKPQEIYLVYPQGNFIRPADSKPYLVIGEVKYGKPILDRVITPKRKNW